MRMIEALPALQRPAAVPIAPVWPVWYRVQTGTSFPASGIVCRALCVVCLASGTACPAACAVQSVRVRWGLGLHLWGIWGEPGVGQVMPAIKFFKEKGVFGVPLANTHPTFTNQNPSNCAILQKFQKIQKDPFRSLDCGIIS